MIQIIKNRVIELLGTIPEIKKIFSYPDSSGKDGYPYLMVTWERNDNDVLDSARDRVVMTFKLTLVQEKLADFKGADNAEKTTDDRAYKIEQLFRDNNDLGLPAVQRVWASETVKSYDSSATRIIISTNLKVQTFANVKV